MKFFRLVLSTKVFSLSALVIALATPLLALHGDSIAVPAASITVMTRNLYAGASFRIFLDMSTPNDVPDRVAKVYAKILSSRFPSNGNPSNGEPKHCRVDSAPNLCYNDI